eukprot:CAMPEP_0203747326 /NCGR_PEP_ID=MMETSP0098-20131031/2511_1 /ASSEMBLY_ACC=CAM_ASM_000208 /TAXON_ID=96639 /ORGANISM=" , Strain NY0313808BC1" /LENGTH=587 /DNA_ID=CAMNT_0050635721 /DNA_START=1954 /DNA_END=3714 /DNA_ORIENTATION=+
MDFGTGKVLSEDEEEPGFEIDWGSNETKTSLGGSEQSTKTVTEDFEIVEPKSDEAETGEKRKKRPKYSKEEREHFELVHRMDLLCQLAFVLPLNEICDLKQLQSIAKAQMPEPFVHMNSVKKLKALVGWFGETFTVSNESWSTDETRIVEALKERKGSDSTLRLLFVTLCRSVGIPCRLVAGLNPKSRLKSGASKRKKGAALGEMIQLFVEVYVASLDVNSESNDSSTWVHVNPFAAKETGCLPTLDKTTPYVIGLGTFDFAVDVTMKYASHWTKTSKERHKENDGWWQCFTLSTLQEKARQRVVSEWKSNMLSDSAYKLLCMSMSNALVSKEEEIMKEQAMKEEMPSSVEGFRKHRRFILETQLTKYQGLKKDTTSVGVFKGTAVYLRSGVFTLYSKTGWRKQGRRVKEEELANPAKRVLPTKRPSTNNQTQDTPSSKGGPQTFSEAIAEQQDDENCDDLEINDGKINLYGEWQTYIYIPPSVGPAGEIPKSEFGNVELWTPSCCPIGAVHVKEACAAQAARELGIDFAPAMVGFERRNMHMVPKLEGIVVAKEFVEVVRAGALAVEQAKLEKLAAKRQERILNCW